MSARDDEPGSGDRVRRSARLDPEAWEALWLITEAYWHGKLHPAAEAALIEALFPPIRIPKRATTDFLAQLSECVASLAERVSQTTKRFNYSDDVVAALMAVAEGMEQGEDAPELPVLVRRVGKLPELPKAPMGISLPMHFDALLPETDFRPFLSSALVDAAKRLGLSANTRILPAPIALPPPQVVRTTRYLDYPFVAVLTALPLAAPSPPDSLRVALRWLRTGLRLKGA